MKGSFHDISAQELLESGTECQRTVENSTENGLFVRIDCDAMGLKYCKQGAYRTLSLLVVNADGTVEHYNQTYFPFAGPVHYGYDECGVYTSFRMFTILGIVGAVMILLCIGSCCVYYKGCCQNGARSSSSFDQPNAMENTDEQTARSIDSDSGHDQ